MKYWKCSKCVREHTTGEEVEVCYCSECLNKMTEVDHGERKINTKDTKRI